MNLSTQKNNFFHDVMPSPWPLVMSLCVFNLTLNFINMELNGWNLSLVMMNLINGFLVSFLWWRDVSRESVYEGFHLKKIIKMVKFGMILFILSEVMFFVSFFWTFFHYNLVWSNEVGSNIKSYLELVSPLDVPLINTLLLLSSGVSITMAHHYLLLGEQLSTKVMLITTIILGFIFSFMQGIEYFILHFNYNWGCFSSIFFLGTMFHGSHVIIGSIFILKVCFSILFLSDSRHTSFELSAWYWHFVDLVWLFLFTVFYWWLY